MAVATRSTTRRAAVCAELPRATQSKASAKTKTTSRTTTKRTRKSAGMQRDVASNEVACMSYSEAWHRKWQLIFAKHPPLDVLPNKYLPHLEEGARAPRFLFGWAFNRDWTLEVARRRRLTFNVERSFRRYLGGYETFNFGDVTEDHLNLPSLRTYLEELALRCFCSYIRTETRAHFTMAQPVTDKWDRILFLWTNYDMRESYRRFQRHAMWSDVEDFMDELMNEGLPSDSERSKAMWWWSFDNNFRV